MIARAQHRCSSGTPQHFRISRASEAESHPLLVVSALMPGAIPHIHSDTRHLSRLLEVIKHDVIPLTERGVNAGNKIFGAALVAKDNLSTVLAETNNEIESPLHHGEMHLLKRYHEWPEAHRPAPNSLIFLSTHEPCSLCLSAITWSGFDTIRYLFTHEDSRDAFAIPHDLKILKEVFDIDPGGYRRDNAFFHSEGIREAATRLNTSDRDRTLALAEALMQRYAELSDRYQQSKNGNSIPLP